MNKTQKGKYGEDLACEYVKKIGYKIVERNFRIRGGEIDIIAIDDDTLVYAEVKTRSSDYFGRPEEAVNYHKLKFLERAAKFFRNNRSYLKLPEAERIDVVAVDISQSTPKFKLIKNAGF